MEIQVKSREEEQENLQLELKRVQLDKFSTVQSVQELERSLKEKEKRISLLRKQQTDLKNLTKISSRNISSIQRLQNDITDMKKQKIDLQRQVMSERKAHIHEVNRLKKEAAFRDREVAKWKQTSHKNSSAAEVARRVAKNRLEEISKLRSKYKDAEKRLRKQTVKRGALARAGVDPTLIGHNDGSHSRRGHNRRKQMDMDRLRKFLSSKVTDVGKMEMIAEKIANEWEEHLELMSRKEDILEMSFQTGEEGFEEDLEAVGVQIKYKENRIRSLTRRLGAKPFVNNKESNKDDNKISFLQDKEYKSLSAGKVYNL